jgi:hypothetical protein
MAGKAYNRGLIVPIVLNYLKEGNSIKDACILAGVSRSVFFKWRKEDSGLSGLVKKAEIEAKNWHLRNIKAHAAKDWKASAWYLERKHRKEWAKEQPEIKVKQSVEVNSASAVISIETVREAANILAELGFTPEGTGEE